MPEKENPEFARLPQSVADAVRFFLDEDDTERAIRYLRAYPDDVSEFCLRVRESYDENDRITPVLRLARLIEELVREGKEKPVVKEELTDRRKQIIPLLDTFLKEGQDRAINLYNFLERTGRSGVIIEKTKDGDEIIGNYERIKGSESVGAHGEKVLSIPISMKGKVVGIIKISSHEDDVCKEFTPASGVNVFYANDIEKEMKGGK